MQIIVPKRYPALTPYDVLVFLIGPVIGGGDWQAKFITSFEEVRKKIWTHSFTEMFLPRIKFVVPCRWGSDHSLAEYFVTAYGTVPESAPYIVQRQTRWEREFLGKVLDGNDEGLVVCGLFLEDKNKPKPKEEGPYARDTYGELGEWTTVAYFKNATNFIIGYSEQFSGIGVRMANFELRFGIEAVKRHFRPTYTPELLAKWATKWIFNTYSVR